MAADSTNGVTARINLREAATANSAGRESAGMGWQRGGRHEFGGGERLLRMAENPRVRQYLGLTDEQVGRLHKIGVDAEKASVQTRADMELRHIELRELLRADNPDHDAIMQKLDEVNALRGKMEKQRVETMLSARSVLTPDQLKKVKTFMENRGEGGGLERGHMMERRGNMGHRPGGPGGAPGGPAPKPPAPPAQLNFIDSKSLRWTGARVPPEAFVLWQIVIAPTPHRPPTVEVDPLKLRSRDLPAAPFFA